MKRRNLLAISTAVLALGPVHALRAQDAKKPFTAEQLGKEFMAPGDEVVLLASGNTLAGVADRAALGIDVPPVELRHVKGHDEPVEVYRLV